MIPAYFPNELLPQLAVFALVVVVTGLILAIQWAIQAFSGENRKPHSR
jgi:hypothetical protein